MRAPRPLSHSCGMHSLRSRGCGLDPEAATGSYRRADSLRRSDSSRRAGKRAEAKTLRKIRGPLRFSGRGAGCRTRADRCKRKAIQRFRIVVTDAPAGAPRKNTSQVDRRVCPSGPAKKAPGRRASGRPSTVRFGHQARSRVPRWVRTFPQSSSTFRVARSSARVSPRLMITTGFPLSWARTAKR